MFGLMFLSTGWMFGLVFLSTGYLSQDLKETSRLKSGFIHATRGGWDELPLLKDKLLESQEKLLQAYKELVALEEEKKEREAALTKAREASERVTEEVVQLREWTASAEETASKAWEEAAFYKDAAAELDKEKNLLKADLASAREAYQELKEECVKSEIARSTAEEARKKALEELEAERARSRELSDDIDRLKRALLEKEGAISQASMVIEDLRVANTDLARSYREIERANTNLVGENTALEEKIRGKLFFTLSCFFLQGIFVLSNFPMLVFVGLKDEPLATQVEARSAKAQLEGEVALNGRLRTAISNLSASWELEPVDESREAARGDALVDQLCYLSATLSDRVRDALHTGVKRAMAVVCSGFSYDMEVVSHSFVTDISKTDAENEERLHALIDDAEVPGERLARLFEPEVLPPETIPRVGDGGEGRDVD